MGGKEGYVFESKKFLDFLFLGDRVWYVQEKGGGNGKERGK